MAFATQGKDGVIQVSVTTQTPDAAGDPVDKPYRLRDAKVDAGKGPLDVIIGPTENAFTFPQPANGGQFMNVSVTLTAEDGKTYATVLPIRSAK
jgi:hypothetical protein